MVKKFLKRQIHIESLPHNYNSYKYQGVLTQNMFNTIIFFIFHSISLTPRIIFFHIVPKHPGDFVCYIIQSVLRAMKYKNRNLRVLVEAPPKKEV